MIGLALAGGGVKGSYEVGAYAAMKKCHLKFDGISGTSIGSFNAAMIVAHKEKELAKFWQEIDVATILGLDEEFAAALTNKDSNFQLIKTGFKEIIKFLKNKGLDVDGLEKVLKDYNVEENVRKSKIDFGLCTYKIHEKEPIEIFKRDIPEGKIEEHILASCFLPIFKPKKLIDNSFYFDGGIFDNCPANMLLRSGYNLVYRVELNAIGRKVKLIDPSKVITISPTRKLSPIITTNRQDIINNYWIGYYDTLKIIKNYPGYTYLFKKKSLNYYKFITRKVPKETMENMMNLFYAKDEEDLVIKVFEHLMKYDNLTYFKIYNPSKLIKKYHHNDNLLTKEFTSHLKNLV